MLKLGLIASTEYMLHWFQWHEDKRLWHTILPDNTWVLEVYNCHCFTPLAKAQHLQIKLVYYGVVTGAQQNC